MATTTSTRLLETLLGSRVRARVVGWLFTHPDESWSVRQLAVLLGEDPTHVSRELAKLESIGIITSSRRGRMKFVAPDRESAIFGEMERLVVKTAGVAGQLAAALASLDGISRAMVYGSFAKGTAGAGSDVDLLVVGEVSLDELETALDPVEKDLGRTVNYVLYDEREFRQKQRAGDGFLTDVLKGPVISVVGNGHVQS